MFNTIDTYSMAVAVLLLTSVFWDGLGTRLEPYGVSTIVSCFGLVITLHPFLRFVLKSTRDVFSQACAT